MKSMTCNQLGGACDLEFQAETFEEIAKVSKVHGTEMYIKGDEAHLAAINEMMKLMKNPEGMQKWMNEKREEFNSLPNNK